jgi:hypothetical protein
MKTLVTPPMPGQASLEASGAEGASNIGIPAGKKEEISLPAHSYLPLLLEIHQNQIGPFGWLFCTGFSVALSVALRVAHIALF